MGSTTPARVRTCPNSRCTATIKALRTGETFSIMLPANAIWRHPFTIARHILQSSYNELSEICQCLSLFMPYLSRNFVSQLSGPQYKFRQLGKIRWRDPVRIELPSITGPRLGARAFDVRNLRHEQLHMPLAIAWPASNE